MDRENEEMKWKEIRKKKKIYSLELDPIPTQFPPNDSTDGELGIPNT